MLILHLRKKRISEKVTEQILVDKQLQQQQQQQQHNKMKKRLYHSICVDESFFFYDSLVRHVWIDERKRPVVRITGSHQHSCIFGDVSIEDKKKQL